MARLDRSIGEINNGIAKEIRKRIDFKTGNLKRWDGKEIIPEKEWNKKKLLHDPDYLEYFPDAFFGIGLFFGAPDDESSRAAQMEWDIKYIEYLEYVKDKKYGRFQCEQCVLNPQVNVTPSFFRGFLIKGLEKKMNLQFPCIVLDIFKCPYGEKKDDLLSAKIVWEIIHDVLRYGRSLTSSFDSTYHVDYEEKKVGFYSSRLGYTMEKIPDKKNAPAIPVRTVDDIYQIVTDLEKFGILLDQYIAGLRSNNCEQYRDLTDKYEMDPDALLGSRSAILDFISGMGGLIKIEDMKDLYVEGFTQYDFSSSDPERQYSTCSCGTVARIHCMNCGAWVCLDHWKEHGVKIHGYVENTGLA